VHRTLRALVCDLEIRCKVLLGSLPASPATEIRQRVEEITARIGGLRSEAQALLGEDLDDPNVAAEHYQTYLRYSRILLTCEHFDLPVILRWGEDDRQITAMCWSLLDQVGWTFPHPHVSAFSNDYYWALPPRNIIGVPANEHERLLGVGDLAHELGHLAFASREAVLVRDTLECVSKYVKATAQAADSDRPMSFFVEMSLSWREWIQEFLCDAFATYLTGPAYAFQNLRLCCMRELLPGAFDIPYRHDHPADDARMQVVLHVLRMLGLDQDATSIGERWQEMIDTVGAAPSSEYSDIYPDELLEVTARNVYTGCRELDLRAYDPAITQDCDVPRLANEAWEQLLGKPESCAVWESQATAGCRAAWATSPAEPAAA
jgi:hypothetical protein